MGRKGWALMDQDGYIQTLINLGLSLLQAKVYMNLVNLEQADVKTIAKASNVARTDTYRIMRTLEKTGLAEKIIALPTMYRATPIRQGYSLLLQNKTREHVNLQKKTIELIKNHHESNHKTALQKEETEFVVTSSKALFFKRIAEREKTVQTSIFVVGGWKGIKFVLFNRFHDLMRALKRGVKIQIITENHEDDKSIQKIVRTLRGESFV